MTVGELQARIVCEAGDARQSTMVFSGKTIKTMWLSFGGSPAAVHTWFDHHLGEGEPRLSQSAEADMHLPDCTSCVPNTGSCTSFPHQNVNAESEPRSDRNGGGSVEQTWLSFRPTVP